MILISSNKCHYEKVSNCITVNFILQESIICGHLSHNTVPSPYFVLSEYNLDFITKKLHSWHYGGCVVNYITIFLFSFSILVWFQIGKIGSELLIQESTILMERSLFSPSSIIFGNALQSPLQHKWTMQ